MRSITGVILAGLIAGACLLTGCASPVPQDCGWESSSAGERARAERLDAAATWQLEHPGEPIPAIDSPYWHGECPTTGGPTAPPVHEDEGQG